MVAALLAKEKEEQQRAAVTTAALRQQRKREVEEDEEAYYALMAAAAVVKRAKKGPKMPRGMEVKALASMEEEPTAAPEAASGFLAAARGRHRRSKDMLRAARGFAPAASFGARR